MVDTVYVTGFVDTAYVVGIEDTAQVAGSADTAQVIGIGEAETAYAVDALAGVATLVMVTIGVIFALVSISIALVCRFDALLDRGDLGDFDVLAVSLVAVDISHFENTSVLDESLCGALGLVGTISEVDGMGEMDASGVLDAFDIVDGFNEIDTFGKI